MGTTPEHETESRLLDAAGAGKRLRAAGLGGSRVSLHRALSRPATANPFPRPLRHTRTGWRYWNASDVDAWIAAERQRLSALASNAPLVPDDNPSRWAPGRRQRVAAAA